MRRHQNLAALAAALFFSLRALPILAKLPSCDSDRPGGESHRTLALPESLLGSDPDEERRQANALCCVYTHVVIDNEYNPYMVTYDESEYYMSSSGSAVDVMKEAMKDICKMYMGSQDCENKKRCVKEALGSGDTSDDDPSAPRCKNRKGRFAVEGIEKKKRCGWAKRKKIREARCDKTSPSSGGKKVSEICPAACGLC